MSSEHYDLIKIVGRYDEKVCDLESIEVVINHPGYTLDDLTAVIKAMYEVAQRDEKAGEPEPVKPVHPVLEQLQTRYRSPDFNSVRRDPWAG